MTLLTLRNRVLLNEESKNHGNLWTQHPRKILRSTYHYAICISLTSLYYCLKYGNLNAVSLLCSYVFTFLHYMLLVPSEVYIQLEIE